MIDFLRTYETLLDRALSRYAKHPHLDQLRSEAWLKLVELAQIQGTLTDEPEKYISTALRNCLLGYLRRNALPVSMSLQEFVETTVAVYQVKPGDKTTDGDGEPDLSHVCRTPTQVKIIRARLAGHTWSEISTLIGISPYNLEKELQHIRRRAVRAVNENT